MKNAKWVPLIATLFAFPVFAQPLSLQDAVSADVKAQMYESQATETSGASVSMQTDTGGPDNVGKTDSQPLGKEPEVAANDHAGISTEHPEKPVAKPEPRKAHAVRHGRKKAS